MQLSNVGFADSHCHLDDSQFAGDREQVIARARAAGVDFMLAIGTGDGPPGLEAAILVAQNYPFVYATVGVHPNDTPKIASDTFADLERLLTHPKVKALGEIGLDYHWGTPVGPQKSAFVRQLEMAAAAKMPIVIHTRDAWTDTLDILRTDWANTGLPCLLHCFSGTVQQAQECIDLGFYLAFGGVATYPKACEVRDAAAITPSEKLLLETDSPYLAPVPFRGKRNEPSYVGHTAKVIAQVRGISIEELAHITTANFTRLFAAGTLIRDQNVQ